MAENFCAVNAHHRAVELMPICRAAIVMKLMIAYLLAISGVSILESSRIGLVVALQMASGAYIWLVLRKSNTSHMATLIGMGIAIGSFLSLASQTFARPTILRDLGYLLPSICVVVHIIARFDVRDLMLASQSKSKAQICEQRIFALCLLNGSMFALTYWWVWLLPVAIITGGTTVWLSSGSSIRRFRKVSDRRHFFYASAMLIVGSVSSIWMRLHTTNFFVFSNDQVFSESLSWSLTRFGPNESPFEAGTIIRYHWLPLAWSGIVSKAASASDWTVVTRVLPIVGFIGIISLVWAILLELKVSIPARLFAVYALVLTKGLLEFSTPVRYTHSLTFLFANIWMLASILIVINSLRSPSINYPLLLMLQMMIFATFGGKVTSGLAILVAFFYMFAMSRVSSEERFNKRRIFVMLILSCLTFVIAFLIFFRSDANTSNSANNTLKIDIFSIGPNSGMVRLDSSFKVKLFGSLVYLFDIAFSYLALGALLFTTVRRKPEFWFISGFMIACVTASLILGHPGGGEIYFMMAGLVVSPILSAWLLNNFEINRFTIKEIVLALLSVVILTLSCKGLLSVASESSSSYHTSVIAKSSIVILSLISCISLSFLAFQRFTIALPRSGFSFLQILSVILIIAGACYGLESRATKFIRQLDYSVTQQNDYADSVTGSVDHLEILHWIRLNTNESAILATNRFCIPDVTPCISKWQLVSAVSHRRMFIEGGYWVGSPVDMATKKMVDVCIRFAASPTFVDWSFLVANGVDYFFVDHAVSPHLLDWKPYATEIMSNKSATLLRLNLSLVESSTGG